MGRRLSDDSRAAVDLPARGFVAIRPGANALAALAAAVERLRAEAAPVSWVRSDKQHVTLKFLGPVAAQSWPDISAALERACGAVRDPAGPLQIGIEGLGRFPARGAPRVLWAGLSGDLARLRALAEQVEAALEPLGFAREPRPLHPHLTIGRVRGRARGAAVPSGYATCSLHVPPEAITHVLLMASCGGEYEVISAHPISGAPPAGSPEL